MGTYLPGEFIFQCHIFLSFHNVHEVLKARILKWFAIPFFTGPSFVRTKCVVCLFSVFFISTPVFLVCSFFCAVFLCPPMFGPVVAVSFVEGEICAEFVCLFVCFSSDGQG